MFKKTVSIVIVSVLAISIGAVSVFADNIPDTNYIESYTQISDDQLLFYIRGSFSSWQIQSTSVDKEYVYSFSQQHISRINYSYFSDGRVSSTVPVYSPSGGSLSSSSSTTRYDIYSREFVFQVGIHNYNSHAVNMNSSWKRFSFTPSDGIDEIFDFSIISNPDNCSVVPYSSDSFLIYFNNALNYYPSGIPSLEAGSDQQCIITFKQYVITDTGTVPSSGSMTINVGSNGMSSYSLKPEWDGHVIDVYTNNIINGINSIDSNVQSILNAYTSNQQGAQNLNNATNSNDQKLENIHNSEAQWYSQNSQAIESTGLSNFEFSSDQSNALTGVFSLFQRLWTALGDYTFVVTFTLMMSFATFFLRHNPVKKTSGNNYSKNYSKGGGSQNGASAG